MEKSRVLHKNIATVPKFDKVTAVLAFKLMEHVMKEINYFVSSVVIWIKSLIVLYYLRKTFTSFVTYVANRVQYSLIIIIFVYSPSRITCIEHDQLYISEKIWIHSTKGL